MDIKYHRVRDMSSVIFLDNYYGRRYTITANDISASDIERSGSVMPESFERGALTEAVYYILLSLYRPAHGYAIMQNISVMTGGRVSLGPGTLYGALNSLIEKKLITGVIGMTGDREQRKKEYVITEAGRKIVRGELERLGELLANGKKITEASGGAAHN